MVLLQAFNYNPQTPARYQLQILLNLYPEFLLYARKTNINIMISALNVKLIVLMAVYILKIAYKIMILCARNLKRFTTVLKMDVRLLVSL